MSDSGHILNATLLVMGNFLRTPGPGSAKVDEVLKSSKVTIRWLQMAVRRLSFTITSCHIIFPEISLSSA